MDWVGVVVVVGTGVFLIPIVNDFQRKTLALSRRLSEIEALVHGMEAANAKDKEEEHAVAADLKEVEKELAEAEQERNALQKAIDAKKRKR